MTPEIPIPQEAIEATAKVIDGRTAATFHQAERLAEAAIRASDEARGMKVERDHIHEPYSSFEGYRQDEVARYRARCHRCNWTGPLRADGSRNENKAAALTDAEAHRQVAVRLVSDWKPVDE